MASFFPEDTGLPMVVWISDGSGIRHDVRVKVRRGHGPYADHNDTVSVSVRPNVEVVAGDPLPTSDMRLVRRWIELNREVILVFWEGKLSPRRALDRMIRVDI